MTQEHTMDDAVTPYALRAMCGALISVAIALRGYRKKKLDLSGAISALIVGFVTILGGIRFAVVLITFFYTSSWLTKYGDKHKKKIEDQYKEGGSRNWEQVAANATFGSVLSLVYIYYLGEKEIPFNIQRDPFASTILAAFIGHYACCNGDTWASELGVLSKAAPRLITTLRTVPTGTNGGITILGCAASTLGGFVIGVAFALADVAVWFLFGEDGGATPEVVPVILLGTLGGIGGSLIDSLMGATIQYSGWSESKKKIVGEPGPGVKRVSGINILNNHHVNFFSSLATGLLAALVVFIASH
eukprot:Phypoly_transcript_12841.p1 GENE.Phypoly_transcript_12841~~Phypoly_transcript_12841.p1  ORF type:complete len:302 (+),score=45.40 Phypoly_transcript_12841:182-1087(+)